MVNDMRRAVHGVLGLHVYVRSGQGIYRVDEVMRMRINTNR